MLEATPLENVPADTKVACEEAFGPVAIIETFSSVDQAMDKVNHSKFGLQAGIFTKDIHKVMKAWDTLEVGGILVRDVPSYRVDNKSHPRF